MSVLSWNFRGLENLRTVNALKRAWKKEALTCVFLMETKLSTNKLNAKKQNWDYNQGLMVSSDGQSGGLALLWKPNTKVHVKISHIGLLMLMCFVKQQVCVGD